MQATRNLEKKACVYSAISSSSSGRGALAASCSCCSYCCCCCWSMWTSGGARANCSTKCNCWSLQHYLLKSLEVNLIQLCSIRIVTAGSRWIVKADCNKRRFNAHSIVTEVRSCLSGLPHKLLCQEKEGFLIVVIALGWYLMVLQIFFPTPSAGWITHKSHFS